MNPVPSVLALIGLYDTATRRLRVLLVRAMNETERQHRRVHLALCRTLLRQLRRDTPSFAQKAMLDTLWAAVRAVDRVGGGTGHLSRVQRQAARIAAENLASPLLLTTARVGRNIEDAFRTTGLVHATAQLIQKAPTGKAAEALREDLARQGLVGFVDKAGRNWQMDTYCRMSVLTTTSTLKHRALADVMIANDLDLVRVPGHAHARDECSPYEWRTWSLTGKAEGYPVLPSLPPWHVLCSHGLVVAHEAGAERARRLAA